MTCPTCPDRPGVTTTDLARHLDWHARVETQGIPPGLCTIADAQAARGHTRPVARPLPAVLPDAAPTARRTTIRYHRR